MIRFSYKTSTVIFGLALTLGLNACSSSQTKEADETEVIAPIMDAGTDAVPQPDIEPIPEASPNLETPPAPEASPSMETPPPISMDSPSSEPTPLQSSSPVDLVNQSSINQSEDYTVQSGDTLMRIAFEIYGDIYKWKAIYEANRDKISDPNSIPKGLVLKIEKPAIPVVIDRNGKKYMIKKGDTLGKISDTLYGTPSKWKELWEHNKQLIQNPNRIFAGFYLYYLAGSESSQNSTSESYASQGEIPHVSESGNSQMSAPQMNSPGVGAATGAAHLDTPQPPSIPVGGEVPAPGVVAPDAPANSAGAGLDSPPPAAQ